MSLHTFRSAKTFRIYGITLTLVQPVFTVIHYTWNELIHPYPPDADTLAIPIFSEFIAWFFLAPFLVYLIVHATRNYPGRVPLFVMNKQKFSWSVWVSIIFGLLLLQPLLFLIDVVQYYNAPLLLDITLGVILLLNLRATLIAKA